MYTIYTNIDFSLAGPSNQIDPALAIRDESSDIAQTFGSSDYGLWPLSTACQDFIYLFIVTKTSNTLIFGGVEGIAENITMSPRTEIFHFANLCIPNSIYLDIWSSGELTAGFSICEMLGWRRVSIRASSWINHEDPRCSAYTSNEDTCFTKRNSAKNISEEQHIVRKYINQDTHWQLNRFISLFFVFHLNFKYVG